MALRIFSTLTGEKEAFAPLRPPKVGVYVCGVTSYDYSHIGHARCYVAFDVAVRVLRARGFDALWVFGVRTWPFSAHCWLQVGLTALDDDLERLAAYTPIMAV